jgi:hypothetical protein
MLLGPGSASCGRDRLGSAATPTASSSRRSGPDSTARRPEATETDHSTVTESTLTQAGAGAETPPSTDKDQPPLPATTPSPPATTIPPTAGAPLGGGGGAAQPDRAGRAIPPGALESVMAQFGGGGGGSGKGDDGAWPSVRVVRTDPLSSPSFRVGQPVPIQLAGFAPGQVVSVHVYFFGALQADLHSIWSTTAFYRYSGAVRADLDGAVAYSLPTDQAVERGCYTLRTNPESRPKVDGDALRTFCLQ